MYSFVKVIAFDRLGTIDREQMTLLSVNFIIEDEKEKIQMFLDRYDFVKNNEDASDERQCHVIDLIRSFICRVEQFCFYEEK